MGVGLDPELTKWSMCLGPAIVLTRKGYKEHHWLVIPHQPFRLTSSSPNLLMPSDCCATSSCIIPGSVNQLRIGRAAVYVCGHVRIVTILTQFRIPTGIWWFSCTLSFILFLILSSSSVPLPNSTSDHFRFPFRSLSFFVWFTLVYICHIRSLVSSNTFTCYSNLSLCALRYYSDFLQILVSCLSSLFLSPSI